MTNATVLRKRWLLPVHLELRLRRLKWLITIVKNPDSAGAMLASWLAPAEWDTKLQESPWIRQLKEDLKSVGDLDGFEYTDSIVEDPLRLFHDAEIKHASLAIDLKHLRSIWLHELQAVLCAAKPSADRPSCVYQCDIIVDETGTLCSYHAKCRASLFHHQVMSGAPNHNVRNMVNFLVVTNQCCFCSSVFADKITTQHHIANTFEKKDATLTKGTNACNQKSQTVSGVLGVAYVRNKAIMLARLRLNT